MKESFPKTFQCIQRLHERPSDIEIKDQRIDMWIESFENPTITCNKLKNIKKWRRFSFRDYTTLNYFGPKSEIPEEFDVMEERNFLEEEYPEIIVFLDQETNRTIESSEYDPNS